MDLSKKDFIRTINSNRGTIRSLCRLYYADPEDQKDAFQDVVLQLWKSFDSFRGASTINTWIYSVTLNTLLSKIRTEKRSVSLEALHSDLGTCSTMADDDMELLRLIVGSLKPMDKALVILHLEGYRHKEIAEILSMSVSNVSTRFNRVKSQLKSKYSRQPHATGRS